jgi:hypothetical protein
VYLLSTDHHSHSKYYLELSETEEESDEKAASQGESDQVCWSSYDTYPIQRHYKSSEYDSESEEEKPKLQFRPVFIPKWAFCTYAC